MNLMNTQNKTQSWTAALIIAAFGLLHFGAPVSKAAAQDKDAKVIHHLQVNANVDAAPDEFSHSVNR